MPLGIHQPRRKLSSVQFKPEEYLEIKNLVELEAKVYGISPKIHSSVMSAVRMRIENLKRELE